MTPINYTDIKLQSLKEELIKYEFKLGLLSDERNEHLRDIEDFNLQYSLRLGCLVENILHLKKEILYRKTSKQKKSKDKYNEDRKLYQDTLNTISKIKQTLLDLEHTLKLIHKDDPSYDEILNVYNELQEELEKLAESLKEQENDLEKTKNTFDENVFKEYSDTKTNYEKFYNEYEDIKNNEDNSIKISDSDKKELKKLWKQACKLCHPDIVPDELKDKAHEIIQSLNEAYSKKDIEKVNKILISLQNGNIFDLASDTIEDKELLKIKIKEYKESITKIESEIKDIKSNPTFITISKLNNWDEYFDKLKIKLENEERSLEVEIINILAEEKETFDFYHFIKKIYNIKDKDIFEVYLESSYLELEDLFQSKSIEDVEELKFELKNLILHLLEKAFIKNTNSKITNAFLILIAQKIEEINSIELMQIIFKYLPESGIKKRLEAAIIYLTEDKNSQSLNKNFNQILTLITNSTIDDDANSKAINAIANYYLTMFSQYSNRNNQINLEELKNLFINQKDNFYLLKNKYIVELLDITSNENNTQLLETNKLLVNNTNSCTIEKELITKEESDYSQKLYNLKNPSFEQIRKISVKYINSIGNPDELFVNLKRGVKIIDDENLLYKYMQSFGAKHKTKLYDSFKEILYYLKDQKFNIIDWGCGQGFATMILLDYSKNENIKLDISDITLIEPSQLALSRGLLHIDVLKQQQYNIKAINSDIDCLEKVELEFDNEYKTLHLFSNILDVESFKLNTDFLQKISSNIKSDNIFVCVSPNINDKRNSRLDLFYKYFDENFDTELISSRDNDISGHRRYEKIFEVKHIKPTMVTEVRSEMIQINNDSQDYYVNIYEKLEKYTSIIEPILDP
ncbi:MAG: methyltransferase domain-containing protein, partial [Campylobacterota bacterium]|nr:methyltransferase domain-containing protein [Campylobacterota bacterium]